MNQKSLLQRFLKPDFFSIEISDRIEAVSQIFQKNPNLQLLSITENGLFLGVIFRLDYVNNFLIKAEEVSIKALLSKQIISLSPKDSVEEAKEIFELKLFLNIPIVDDFGKLCGVLNPQDLQQKIPIYINQTKGNIYWT